MHLFDPCGPPGPIVRRRCGSGRMSVPAWVVRPVHRWARAIRFPGSGSIPERARSTTTRRRHCARWPRPCPHPCPRAAAERRAPRRGGHRAELQRNLAVTTAGVQENGSRLAVAILELTCRRFYLSGRRDHAAVGRFSTAAGGPRRSILPARAAGGRGTLPARRADPPGQGSVCERWLHVRARGPRRSPAARRAP